MGKHVRSCKTVRPGCCGSHVACQGMGGFLLCIWLQWETAGNEHKAQKVNRSEDDDHARTSGYSILPSDRLVHYETTLHWTNTWLF